MVLREAWTRWSNARSASEPASGYIEAVNDTYPALQQVFAVPDLAAGVRSGAYWHLLSLIRADASRSVTTLVAEPDRIRGERALNGAFQAEFDNQLKALEAARVELDALKELAARPGLPVVYDTNMLNHWQQPGDIRWREVLKAQGEQATIVRLVVPLRVIDELDRQKYGGAESDLARKAATAIRYLERHLKTVPAGKPAKLRENVTLEAWLDTDLRDIDPDLAILECAADLNSLHPGTGARVITNDCGMRLRASQMSLKVVALPDEYRKKGTAMDLAPPL
ncbi:PIN domain-containing protein [Actinomadura harenae]|uniref:PIN domain-containing protein n=1 Tax=Actinomadura harenae TaxID=2483351 RepID=A0A3M2L8D8_9ACTN|nr:PIN domain-containing protein [Actinomadura harenae]RMI33871.1 hypothetical protein EBO15_41150 [Actinomadura harenae]